MESKQCVNCGRLIYGQGYLCSTCDSGSTEIPAAMARGGGFCAGCGRSLGGINEGVCPQCGQPVGSQKTGVVAAPSPAAPSRGFWRSASVRRGRSRRTGPRRMPVTFIAACILLGAVAVAGVVFAYPSLHRTSKTVANMAAGVNGGMLQGVEAAQELAVKASLRSLAIGIQAYAADHGEVYPDPSSVTPKGLVAPGGSPYVDPWPTNPYTNAPMVQGAAAGDFTYSRSATGNGYTLRGYGADGKVLHNLLSERGWRVR